MPDNNQYGGDNFHQIVPTPNGGRPTFRFNILKDRHRIRFENETEEHVTLIVEPIEGEAHGDRT